MLVGVQAVEAAEDDEVDDDDLVASVSGLMLSVPEAGAAGSSSSSGPGSWGTRRGGLPPPTVFASLSMSLNRASDIARNALDAYAAQAPRRRGLTRPSQRQ